MEVTQTQRRVIYTSRKLWWFLSDVACSSMIWLSHGLILTYFYPTQRHRIVLILYDCQ